MLCTLKGLADAMRGALTLLGLTMLTGAGIGVAAGVGMMWLEVCTVQRFPWTSRRC